MPHFTKHYTRDEARKLLPQITEWLAELRQARDLLTHFDEQLGKALGLGDDLGGELVNRYVRTLAKMKDTLLRFARREIQIKDLDRGLIDFPAYVGGKEVFLCWESGEEDIEFWHDLTSGYGGRERL
ncbi:MAG: DUF2203 family protein [Limisphaerales bacterium]